MPYQAVYTLSNDGGDGSSGSTNGATIAIIVIVSLLVLALIIVLVVQACNRKKKNGKPSYGYGAKIANDVDSIRRDLKKHPVRAAIPSRSPPRQASRPAMHRSQQHHQHQRQQRARYGAANPAVLQHHEPVYDMPASMPSQQLNSAPFMAPTPAALPGVPSSSNIIGDGEMDLMGTEQMGTSANPYSDGNYTMDPGMMTPSSATDIKGLQTFMPYMGGGIGNKEEFGAEVGGGPVDPSTGLPLFTTGKLVRSQLLGGHGAGSFLRQVQDPMTGYRKSVGKVMCGTQQARRDIEVRRKQFNAARLEHPDNDPILFNMSDWAVR